jgi:hypothetical protein
MLDFLKIQYGIPTMCRMIFHAHAQAKATGNPQIELSDCRSYIVNWFRFNVFMFTIPISCKLFLIDLY